MDYQPEGPDIDMGKVSFVQCSTMWMEVGRVAPIKKNDRPNDTSRWRTIASAKSFADKVRVANTSPSFKIQTTPPSKGEISHPVLWNSDVFNCDWLCNSCYKKTGDIPRTVKEGTISGPRSSPCSLKPKSIPKIVHITGWKISSWMQTMNAAGTAATSTGLRK